MTGTQPYCYQTADFNLKSGKQEGDVVPDGSDLQWVEYSQDWFFLPPENIKNTKIKEGMNEQEVTVNHLEQQTTSIISQEEIKEILSDGEENDIDGLTPDEQYHLSQMLIRNTPEYKAAWELELWKRQEKQRFVTALKLKEKHQLDILKEEQEARELKRKAMLEEQQNKLKAMESEMITGLETLKKKEQRLLEVESELRRRKSELEAEHARKLEDLEHSKNLFKNDCSHQIELKQRKADELEDMNMQLQQRLRELEHQHDQLLKDHHAFYQKVSNSDQAQLRGEISKLIMEKDNLQKKLEESNRSKKNYKNQWRKALSEINSLKQSRFTDIENMMEKERKNWVKMKSAVSPQTPSIPPYMYPYQSPMYMQPQIYSHPIGMLPHHHTAHPGSPARSKDWSELQDLKKQVSELIQEVSTPQQTAKQRRDISSSSEEDSSDSEEEDQEPVRETPKPKILSRVSSNTTVKRSSPQIQRDQQLKQTEQQQGNKPRSPPSSEQSTPEKVFHEHIHKYRTGGETDKNAERERKRLELEKHRLLQTGLYHHDSEIIVQLDRKIHSLR